MVIEDINVMSLWKREYKQMSQYGVMLFISLSILVITWKKYQKINVFWDKFQRQLLKKSNSDQTMYST